METSESHQPVENSGKDQLLSKFRDTGYHLRGQFDYTYPGGSGLSHPVQYAALIDPWGDTRDEQIVRLTIDITDQLNHELLAPVRAVVRKIVDAEITKIEREGD